MAETADLRHNASASRLSTNISLSTNRRPPLSGKKPTTQTTRRDRRAAERQDRFSKDRDERRGRAPAGKGGSSLINTRNMTIVGVIVGVLIVVVVGIGQLGGKVTGTLKDPAAAYPAALLDGTAIGKADAPVVMEVYEDYQCPYCGKYSLDVEPVLVSQYVTPGTLRIVHRDIGILGRGGPDDESVLAARGGFCANEQGKYWDYAHWVYANQDGENAGGFRRERLTAIAEAAGLETGAFSACLDGAAATAAVDKANAEATAQGISSTPTMYVNGKRIEVSLDPNAIGAEIEAAAAASGLPDASASAVP